MEACHKGFALIAVALIKAGADVSHIPSEAASSSAHIVGYNPDKRDPRYAFSTRLATDAGDVSLEELGGKALWEASLLRWHFHPSVQHFAMQLLAPPGHGIK